jgi:phosphotriesterase-related protein
VDVPSDTERIDQLIALIEDGHGDRLLASHDVCLKTRLAAYGGGGFAHLLASVAAWMDAKGMTADQVDAILRRNPQRVLAVG